MKNRIMQTVSALLVFAAASLALAQQVGKDPYAKEKKENKMVQAVENGRKIKAVGTVKGTIYIKNVSGNNLGDFGCRNLIVHINPLGGNPPKWRLSRIGTGDFSTRKCSYSIQNVPSAESFGISLRADFPNACDQKVFKADAGFPTKIKTGETLTHNLGVSQISCTLAK